MLNRADSVSTSVTSLESSASAEKTITWLPWAISSAIILLLGGGIWWLINQPSDGERTASSSENENCIEDITNVPSGDFKYTIEPPTRQKYIFNINETYKNACEIDFKTKNFKNFTEIISQKQDIHLHFEKEEFNNREELISNIKPHNINFALFPNPLVPNPNKNKDEFMSQEIAYDGLLVYVTFQDCEDCEQLGKYLEEKITLEQLQEIYTGKVDSWKQINPSIPSNIGFQAFVPKDDFALELFGKLVFEKEEDIKKFEKAIEDPEKILQLETSNDILEKLRDLWYQKKKIGGIGFGFQNEVFKQCNVYPLFVVKNTSAPSFPMLIKKDDQQGVNLFRGEDLACIDKSEYQLNETVFRNLQYPLAFSWNLLYRNTNEYQNLELGETITEIFQTQEFQCHLYHKKLIPLKLSEKDCVKDEERNQQWQ